MVASRPAQRFDQHPDIFSTLLLRWTAEALQKYMKSTRSEAPYLPSNVQYIANNNALDGKDDVSHGHYWLQQQLHTRCLSKSVDSDTLPFSHHVASMSVLAYMLLLACLHRALKLHMVLPGSHVPALTASCNASPPSRPWRHIQPDLPLASQPRWQYM